jgi:hypothetical protein
LTEKEWDKLKASCPEDAAEWIEKSDIADSEEMEEFDAYVCGEDGKPVKPVDQYDGGE